MKNPITLLLVALSFICAHPKLATVVAISMTATTADAQFIQDYRPPYKAAFYPGNWSGKDLYIVRDEADALTGEFRFNVPVKISPLALPHNDGSPSNVLWMGSDTLIKASPLSQLSFTASQVSGLSSVATSGSYNDLSNKPTITTYSAGTGIAISGGVISNTATATFTVNAPVSVPSHSVASTAYQPSTTKATRVSITALVTSTVSLTGGQTGEVVLQYSSNGSTWTSYASSPGSSTGGLVVGLTLNQGTGGQLSVDLPIGWYWRWIPSGTGTFSVKNIFETPIN